MYFTELYKYALKQVVTSADAIWNFTPGIVDTDPDNSQWINTLKAVPTIPANPPNSKYRVPISLWLVEKTHLVSHFETMYSAQKMGLEKSIKLTLYPKTRLFLF